MFVVIGLLVFVLGLLVIAMFPPTRKCRGVGCAAANPVEARFCRRCGQPLIEKLILQERSQNQLWGWPMKMERRTMPYGSTPDRRAQAFATID